MGAIGAGVPLYTRRADAKDARAHVIRDQRAEAYEQLLLLAADMPGLGPQTERSAAVGVGLWMWGSRDVREAFFDYLRVYPSMFGPDSTEADRRAATASLNNVRQIIADELQKT